MSTHSPVELEVIRREHLNREASVQAMALLYYLIAAALLVATIYALSTGGNAGLEVRPGVWGRIDVLVYAAGVVVTLVIGYGLQRLRPWARIAAIGLGAVGLLRIPVGTLLFPYFLYLLLSAEGRRVFAPDYAAIVAATPHLKYPKSIVVLTVLAALIAFVAIRTGVRLAVRG